MHLRVLGSSSAGNSTLIWNERTAVMIDCGFSPRYLSAALESLDLDIPTLAGVLITHVHGDHVNDDAIHLLIFNRIPIFARRELTAPLKRMYPSIERADQMGLYRDFSGAGLELGTFEIDSFGVPHDSPGGCFGFSLFAGAGGARRKVTLATDLGFAREGLLEKFRDSHAVVIESNHDSQMLENSSRPEWLKKRIREIGHLSNDQCAEFVSAIVQSSTVPPRGVMLAHISQQCNTNALAQQATSDSLARTGASSIRVHESFKAVPSTIVSF